MRTNRRRTRTAAMVALVVLGLTACSGVIKTGSTTSTNSKSSNSGTKTIGLAVADLTSLFFIAVEDGVKQYAAAHGYKVIVESANDDSNTQVSQVQTLITDRVSALVYVPAGAAAANVPVLDANQAGIPVVAVDREPSSGGGKLVSFIASNSVAASDQLCTWMAKQIHGSGPILQIQGQLGTTPEVARQTGCNQALKRYPGIHTVAEQAANWDENQGYAAAQNMLEAHRNAVAIFAHSDAMALGAGKAAQQAGVKPIIVSVDGFPTEFQALKAGQVSATESQQPYHMGQLATEDAILAVEGKAGSVPRVQYQPTVLVTRTNVSRYAKNDYYGPLGP